MLGGAGGAGSWSWEVLEGLGGEGSWSWETGCDERSWEMGVGAGRSCRAPGKVGTSGDCRGLWGAGQRGVAGVYQLHRGNEPALHTTL